MFNEIRIPMLTGASGALGGPYGSPYMPVDGSYYSGPSQQASSSVSLRYAGLMLILYTMQNLNFVLNLVTEVWIIVAVSCCFLLYAENLVQVMRHPKK
jgi:hypothetical protein